MWGFATACAGLVVAAMSPVLGSIADAGGQRKPWIAAFGTLLVFGSCMLWFGRPGDAGVIPLILCAYAIGVIGVEFAAVFNNAMMPTLVPPERIGRLSGTGWATGYVGGLLSLIVVLGFLAGNPQTGKTLLGISPLFGLDPALARGRPRGRSAHGAVVHRVRPAAVPLHARRAARPADRRGGAARRRDARRHGAQPAAAQEHRGLPARQHDLCRRHGGAVRVRRHLRGRHVRLGHDPDRHLRHPAQHHGDDRRLSRRQARRPARPEAGDPRQPDDPDAVRDRVPVDRARSRAVRRAGRAAGSPAPRCSPRSARSFTCASVS